VVHGFRHSIHLTLQESSAMSLWKRFSLPRLIHPVRTSPRAGRFRPALHSLEDRTVPSADLFADATVLTGSLVTATASNAGATAEASEPAGEGTSGEVNSVWWSWTAPANGYVEVNTIGSDFDTLLAVYTGSSVDSLALVAANDDAFDTQSQLLFLAQAGETYHIAVDGFDSTTGNIVLKLGTTPANDNFNAATVVAGGTVTGGNLAATREGGEPEGASDPVNSVWWNWAAAASGEVSIDTVGSDFDTLLAVYSGDVIDNLTLVAANDDFDFPNSLASKVTFNAVAGTSYRISIDGYLNETGNIVLNLPDAPPDNQPPAISNQSFSVNENSPAGMVVGTVAASDPDAGQTLSYAIIGGNGAGVFAIDSATGRITVADAAALDFESTTSFTLTVQVTDSGSPALAASATVTVNLNDVNESPSITSPAVFDVDENSAIGTLVGRVSASDPDAGQTLRYAIVAGNSGGAFAIDSISGDITVANTSALNYESTSSFSLTVEVRDDGVPVLPSTSTVMVNLNDVNDAPVLDNSGSMALGDIKTGQTNNSGTRVADLLASAGNRVSDEDAGALRGIAIVGADTSHGSWQYSLDNGATWLSLGSVSNGSARLLSAGARIRFVPGLLYSGTITNALTFRAWDQTSGVNGGLANTSTNGGSTAFSTATETASIQVRGLLGLGILGL
jgi:VCBS repeat-containing protein